MKRIEIDNCYQCLYYQTFGGQSCGKIIGTKRLTAKEAKNIPDWCPLPDVEEKSNNLSRCDVCGNKFEARESGFCPYCNTGYISK